MAGLSSSEDIVGLTDRELPRQFQAESSQNLEQEIMASAQTKSYEESVTLASGETATYLTTKAPYYNNEKQIIGLIGTLIDITELKNTQTQLKESKAQAEAANFSKSNFLSVCGHELRTPASYILGICDYFIKLLEDDELTMELIKEHLPMIQQNAKDLNVLIEDVLENTKLELGQTKLILAPVNLRETLAALYKQSCTHINSANITLDINYPDSIPSYVWGDQNRIRQVYNNYMNNAFKFSPVDGQIHTIVSEMVHPETKKHMIKISIKDMGIGIAPEKLDDVWERFQQVHAKTSDERYVLHKGLGLGLSIVKELVTLMQGEVSVESTLGEGSTFSFTLPVWDEEKNKLAEEEKL